ncbi:hypothetical protein [Bradyrhizobium sp. HKCCYLS20291]|uniref:hypothetical protein n=1 Tax=Bradyrhizobium sp. HKCCYLS20291 TaxID=3420766 RepID=UPI003EB96826
MTIPDPVQELLDQLGCQLAEEELNVRQKVDRAIALGNTEAARHAWAVFHGRVEPIRAEIDYIIRQLAAIEACRAAPAPMIFQGGDLVGFGWPEPLKDQGEAVAILDAPRTCPIHQISFLLDCALCSGEEGDRIEAAMAKREHDHG